MQQIPASLLTLLVGVLVTLISLWVGQNHGLLPEQASEQAPLVDGFFNVMITIGVALFLLVEGAILFFAIKYRRRPGDNTDGIPLEGSIPLEILWTAIPAVIVIGLGTYSVDVYERMGGFANPSHGAMAHHAPAPVAKALPGSAIAASLPEGTPVATTYGISASSATTGQAADLVVNVTGMQYAWIFNYPNDQIISGELHIPVGQAVQLNLSASDVIHSFWVPQFRLKQDVMPGQSSEMRFIATKTGTFPIVCTELCGSYHGGMRSQVVIHPPEEYKAWVAEHRIAQQPDLKQAIALNPADLSSSEFLAPYAQEMGVEPSALAQLQTHPHS